MEDLFIKILNMSITASYFVVALLLLRAIFRKIPKWINCALWGLVGLRLILPFSFESILSLIPSAQTIPPDIAMSKNPQISSGIPAFNSVINPIISESFTPEPSYSVNPLQVVSFIASVLWITGIAAMLIYTLVSYLLLRRKTRESIKNADGTYICDAVASPFILGIIKPKIYIPSQVSDSDRNQIIAHEKAHIKRLDHLWKPLGFLILSVYWFNPLMWLAYIFLCRDIEAACDEKVLKNGGAELKKSYSEALINCSVPKKLVTACPLAFGETGVKQRIKNILSYKKPAFWIIISALIVSIILSACFMTNPGTTRINDVPGYEAIFKDVTKLQFFTGENTVYTTEDPTEELRGLKKVKLDKAGEVHYDYAYKIEINDRFLICIDNEFSLLTVMDNIYLNKVTDNSTDSSVTPIPTSTVYSIKNPEVFKDFFLDATDRTIIIDPEEVTVFTGYSGIYITLDSISNNNGIVSFNVNWHNETDKPVSFGEIFKIEYVDGTEYIDITPKDTVWITIAYLLKPDTTIPHTYSVAGLDMSRNGTYRISTNFSLEDGRNYKADCGFSFESIHGSLIDSADNTTITTTKIAATDNMALITEYEGVYITLDSVTTDKNGTVSFNLDWHNETDKLINFGEVIKVEFDDGTGYLDITPKDAVWDTLAFLLKPNNTVPHRHSLLNLDISRSGTYRITTTFAIPNTIYDNWSGPYKTQVIFSLTSTSNIGGTSGPTAIVTAKQLTIEDVIRLSKKGDELTWSDFDGFAYNELLTSYVGEDITRSFRIDDRFFVTILGNPAEKPRSVLINTPGNGAAGISLDIRNGNVEEWIQTHEQDPVIRTLSCSVRSFAVDKTGDNYNSFIDYGCYLPPVYNRIQYLPVIRIDSYDELMRFRDYFDDKMQFDDTYNDWYPTFQELCELYNTQYADFFKHYVLFIAYCTKSNTANYLSLGYANVSEGILTLCINEHESLDSGTDETTGCINVFEIAKSDVQDVNRAEAFVYGEIPSYDDGGKNCLSTFTYIESAEQLIKPNFKLYEDGTFMFVFHPLSSYLGYGTYRLDGAKLVLTTNDGQVYKFKEDNFGNYVFDAENSSENLYMSDIVHKAVFYKTR